MKIIRLLGMEVIYIIYNIYCNEKPFDLASGMNKVNRLQYISSGIDKYEFQIFAKDKNLYLRIGVANGYDCN